MRNLKGLTAAIWLPFLFQPEMQVACKMWPMI